MSNNGMLRANSERLSVRDPATIQKAETFLRILSTKPASKTINDVAKMVLCLDLAASYQNVSFDKETALKLTGLRKTQYQNNLNNVEKILNLDKPVTVPELCVQFSCTEAKDTANLILLKYKELDTKIKDIAHPQYAAAAVYISCKLTGIKVDKTQLKLVSRLKTAQWNEILEQFNKFAESLGISADRKRKTKKQVNVEEENIYDDICPLTQKMKEKEDEIEDYDKWKERILNEAAKEILQRELEDD